MTDVLEVVGLVALVVSGFLVALWLGFLAVGVGCLVVAGSMTRKKRLAAEAEVRRREMAVR